MKSNRVAFCATCVKVQLLNFDESQNGVK